MPKTRENGPSQEGVLREVAIAKVVEGAGKGSGKPDVLVELANGEQPGIAGELACGRLDHERRAEEIEALGPRGWYTHRWFPWEGEGPGGSTG